MSFDTTVIFPSVWPHLDKEKWSHLIVKKSEILHWKNSFQEDVYKLELVILISKHGKQ